jgi:putative salt-induced outer membrane protein YdiY
MLLCLAIGPGLWADQITFTNGDRVSGTVVTVDATTVVLKTEAMGEVKIDRKAVASITSEQPLTVMLKSGGTVVGQVTAEQDRLRVEKSDHAVVSAGAGDWEAMRNAAAQQAWEREQTRLLHPPLTDFWSGDISLNLATASGNARTTTFGIGGTVQRITGFDKIALTYTQIYSKQSTTPPFGATANRISSGLRYDRDFTKKFFAFGITAFDYDRFQDLDLRSVLGGGLGYHAYKSPRGYWDLGAGGTWNREAFSTGLTRNSGEVVTSEESSHQINTILQVQQRLAVFPNLTRRGEYRLNFDAAANMKLTKLLNWNVTLSDRRLSNPLPGRKANDVILTMGISLRFEQK